MPAKAPLRPKLGCPATVSEPQAKHLEHALVNHSTPQIVDIRRQTVPASLADGIVSGLAGKPPGQKSLPTMLLYSAEGLKLFEEITFCDEYYLTNTEIEVLSKYAAAMAERIEDGSMVVELGSGNLRKVKILLDALDRIGKKITYYALDLDRSELERTLALISDGTFKNIECFGLHGTYDDGKAWLQTTAESRPRCILWLGSSAGNFDREGAAQLLRGFADHVLRPGKPDLILVGLDGTKDGDKVYVAYNDSAGITERFILSGLDYANDVLGGVYFNLDDWEYIGEWNAQEGRHQAYLVPKKDISFPGRLEGVSISKGERVHIEYSYKFDDGDCKALWDAAGLGEATRWANDDGNYFLYMLYKPCFRFHARPVDYASEPPPTLDEWKQLWASWDAVALGMIPKGQMLSKPIDLRNPCIFYLGHIPNFLDCVIVRGTGAAPTKPAAFSDIFLRGIDPDVDNPESCHSHSQLPDSWPDLEEILDYTRKVRERVIALYRDGSAMHLESVQQRALWLGFEHEAMHLETLLYMLLQSDATLPPQGIPKPDFVSRQAWERLRENSRSGASTSSPCPSPWVEIPTMKIDVGIDDREEPEVESPHYFAWDNEKPARKPITVTSFTIRAYPITNEEYAAYLYAVGSMEIPAAWSKSVSVENGSINGVPNGTSEHPHANKDNTVNGSRSSYKGEDNDADPEFLQFLNRFDVKTVYGCVPLKLAADWPVMASYNELASAASWMGGRIPTKEEVNATYNFADEASRATGENKLSGMIDAVNGHLTQNGVTETPPLGNEVSGSHEESLKRLKCQRERLFQDLDGKNVGFANWHPTSVKAAGRLLGRGEMGGAWEWTSSQLERHDGFVKGKLYPEYTDDFFDGKHNIVLGGSWATHPRLAGRKSFVNWYQRNYRYTWATARIVKD